MTLDPNRPTNASVKPKDKQLSAGSKEAIIIDLGKKSRKQVRRLQKGRPGRLMNRIEEAMAHLRDNGALAADVQPIVVVVKERVGGGGSRRVAKMWGMG